MKERILVVDDDEKITNLLRRALSYEGYVTDIANDGHRALSLALDHHPDLVILDIQLPGMDGLEVCRRLREGGSEPILMLTARDEVSDRVQGLDSGADDYLVKPFALEELLARVRALLRRREPEARTEMRFSDLVLDTASREARRGERVIELSAKEFDLLSLFMRNPRRVLTREHILEQAWGYDFYGESNVIEVYVGYLRAKIDRRFGCNTLQTVRGSGYVLRDENATR